jgi:AraC-like DNA-binding protein
MFSNLDNLLSISIGLIGVILILVMLLSYKSNIFVNIYLVVIIMIISIRFLAKGLQSFNIFEQLPTYDLSVVKSISLIGIPSFYLYVKSLINDVTKYNIRFLIHFWFPVLNILFFLFSDLLIKEIDNQLFSCIHTLCVLIFISWYITKLGILLCNSIFLKNEAVEDAHSIHFKKIKKWLIFMGIVAIISAIRLLVSIYIEHINGNRILGFSFFFINNIIWLTTFLYILVHPEILYGYPKLKKYGEKNTIIQKPNSAIWSFVSAQIENKQDQVLYKFLDDKTYFYINKIEQFIALHHPFRNNDYTLKNLANDLGLPSSHLSFIFKYNCTISFSEFKNQSRIIDALQLIKEDFLFDKTFDALASKVGFSSYNTFFISFKKYTNYSPIEFVMEQKNKQENEYNS